MSKLARQRFLRFCTGAVVCVWNIVAQQTPQGDEFVPAYFSSDVMTVFKPETSEPKTITVPKLGSYNYRAVVRNGSAVLFQIPAARFIGLSDALLIVDLRNFQENTVPGSTGFGDIASITVSADSRQLLISTRGGAKFGCGYYSLDIATGVQRRLESAAASACGDSVGEISPDGSRVLVFKGSRTSVVDLRTGAWRDVGPGPGSWSPDGKWIALSGRGHISLIDSSSLSVIRKLGRGGVGDNLTWEPNGSSLLIVVSDIRCLGMDDAESLVAVDVATGKHRTVNGGRCAVTSARVGWVSKKLF